MSDWQKILREQSVSTLEQLAERFGRDVIDVEARASAVGDRTPLAAVGQR